MAHYVVPLGYNSIDMRFGILMKFLLASGCTALAALLICFPALAQDEWTGGFFGAAEAERMFGTQAEEITIDDARTYMLELVNRERAKLKLQPLAMDEYAQKVGQWHADEMAVHSYISHWDIQGFTPTMRYTAGGGNDGMSENVTFFACGVRVYLTRKVVEYMHSSFMGSEGHRVNLLKPEHNKLGVGIGFALFPTGECVFTCDQTFVDDYGGLAPIPQSIKLGEPIAVSGTLDIKRAKLRYVGLGWDPFPQPIAPEAMNANLMGGQNPGSYNLFLPKGSAAPEGAAVPTDELVEWNSETGKYSCTLDLSKPLPGTPMPPDGAGGPGTPGVYYIFIWATLDKSLVPEGWENREDYFFLAGVWTLGGVN